MMELATTIEAAAQTMVYAGFAIPFVASFLLGLFYMMAVKR